MLRSVSKRISDGGCLSVEMSRQEIDRNYNNQTGFPESSQRYWDLLQFCFDCYYKLEKVVGISQVKIKKKKENNVYNRATST